MSDTDPLLTYAEVARLLAVSVSMVRGLVRTGKLEKVEVGQGHSPRVLRSEVKDYIERNRRPRDDD